ncbi:MAG: methyl-accepting chemotaxis protein [bacterium]
MEAKTKRSNYFIKKAFQLKFISIFLALIIIGSLFLGWTVYRMTNQALARTFYQSHIQIRSTWEIIFPAVAVATLLAIFISGAVSTIIVLVFSHKIAGPLYRFEKTLEEIAKGDFTIKTKFRETDELELLADKLNLFTSELNTRLNNIKAGFDKLSECLQKLNYLDDSPKNKEIKNSVENLNKIINQFKF